MGTSSLICSSSTTARSRSGRAARLGRSYGGLGSRARPPNRPAPVQRPRRLRRPGRATCPRRRASPAAASSRAAWLSPSSARAASPARSPRSASRPTSRPAAAASPASAWARDPSTSPRFTSSSASRMAAAPSPASARARVICAASSRSPRSASKPASSRAQGSRISGLRMALALRAVLLLVLVFILQTASAWTSAISVLTGTCRWGRAPAGAILGYAPRRDGSARAQHAAAERGAPKSPNLTQARCRTGHDGVRRQNPPSQAACRSQGRATRPSGHARQRSLSSANQGSSGRP